MNFLDPKWLDVLKAKGLQLLAVSLACILLIWMFKSKIIPTTASPLWIAIPAIVAVIFGFLGVASVITSAIEIFDLKGLTMSWLKKRQDIKQVKEYLPFMTKKDKEIIGYLLFKNQRMFQHEMDGGYAAPLISKGIIRISAYGRQSVLERWVPFEIPEHIWNVLVQNRESFPYKMPKEKFVYPWAIHYMLK